MNPFRQPPPALGHQYTDDRVLQAYLQRMLPEERQKALTPALMTLGEAAGGWLYDLQLKDYAAEPTLTRYSPWGERIDRIDVTRVWQEAEPLAATHGLVGRAYAADADAHARVEQMALAYLFIPSTDIFGCPLAMTDGAARALLASGNKALIDCAVPHLISRDPATFWTSGQWMTELPGGSDVSRTETVARQDADGTWRLYGRKWFTSAVTSQMALALARPEGNDDNSNGLALFYVELRDADGRLQGLTVNRLKEKLGTRKLPTAELTLDGLRATPVAGLTGGVRAIAPMLNITRTWNAVTAVALMRRGLALARDYASKRQAFGHPLAELPLHADTLAGLQATYEGAFHLTFRTVELLGAEEHGTAAVAPLLRLLTPLSKLTTARQGVAVASEIVEAFGGNGYVEDTGIPPLLRDMQVLSIWEGTTNVLSLDVLRALQHTNGLAPLQDELQCCRAAVTSPELTPCMEAATEAFAAAADWLAEAQQAGSGTLQAGARRFALTLGHALEAALLARHAQWRLDHDGDARAATAAQRLAAEGLNHLHRQRDRPATQALAMDTPLPHAATAEAMH